MSTVKPRTKQPVNFDFRLMWFLYNWYLGRNQAHMVLYCFLFPLKNRCRFDETKYMHE